ncbi:hypothetical protein ACFVTC_30110 [Streptomyces sp. NPDC057950]|uniref:hypothetical protein n=1 Tax=Streptomyces sp. NPDC057950 TaxID=3346288 RepID=UPI0036E2B246
MRSGQTGWDGPRQRDVDFLRTRRARITPESAGLPAEGRPRRVPGLRREEAARPSPKWSTTPSCSFPRPPPPSYP